jgi:hypothetical protein
LLTIKNFCAIQRPIGIGGIDEKYDLWVLRRASAAESAGKRNTPLAAWTHQKAVKNRYRLCSRAEPLISLLRAIQRCPISFREVFAVGGISKRWMSLFAKRLFRKT